MKKGNLVTVAMSASNIFPWQTAKTFRAVFLQHPQGEGDTYRVGVNGRTVLLNGNSSLFVAIYGDKDD